jgi:eukaryotic-like serine/threonine-protein kinase
MVLTGRQTPGYAYPMDPLAARVNAALAGRYRVIRELDTHGRAPVFLATDVVHGRQVALKVVPAGEGGDESAASFLASLRAAVNLEHPHITTQLDFGMSDGIAFSALPYVEGASLADRLRIGEIETDQAIEIALEIGEALDHAHAHGVVHGAVHAENILLSSGRAELSFFDARGIADGADVAADIEAVGELLRRMILPGRAPPRLARILARTDPSSRRHFGSMAQLVEALRSMATTAQAGAGGRRGLIEELKRRKVIGTALLYVGASLALVEGAGMFAGPLGLPPWTQDYVARLAVLGLPLALILAWAFDITTSGLRWTEPRSSRTRSPGALRAARLRRMAAVTIAGCVFVVGAVLSPRERESAALAAERSPLDPTHVALLEFDGRDGSSELAVLARKLHDRLVEGLHGVPTLSVVSTLNTSSLEGETIESVARNAGAGTIVWPRIDADGDSVRVMLRVLDGETGEYLRWSSVTVALLQQVRLDDAVGDSLTDLLRHELGEAVPEREWQRATRSEEAYRYVTWASERLGQFHAFMAANDRAAAERALDEAEELLDRAEELDTEWIEPILQRSTLVEHRYMLAVARGLGRGDSEAIAALRDGIRHANRALLRRPDDASALHMRGTLRHRIWSATSGTDEALADSAESDLRRAINGHPVRARVYERLADHLGAAGRHGEALQYALWAYEQDPYLNRRAPNLQRLYQLNYEMRIDTAAARYCEEGLQRFSGLDRRMFHQCTLELMAWSDAVEDDPDRAWSLMEAALEGFPPAAVESLAGNLRALVAGVLVRAGMPDSALAVVAPVRTASNQTVGSVAPAAAVLARTGRVEDAIRLLEEYLAANPHDRDRLLSSRELDTLRERTDLFRPLPRDR